MPLSGGSRVTEVHESLLSQLGFRFGIGGAHASRTLMLDDLRVVLADVPVDAPRSEYADAVVVRNVLGKPTRNTRELAYKYLVSLYGLDPAIPLFRAIRRLWSLNESAQPMLALGIALARDPLLRSTQSYFLEHAPGTVIPREATEKYLAAKSPDRFSAATLKSLAQNVAGSWTVAGILNGRQRKVRAIPEAYPESVTLLLFLAYLNGRAGQRLFTSEWMQILGRSTEEIEALTSAASHRGLLVFMNAGGVKEVRFPGYLTADEERIRQEATHVI